MLNSGGYVGVGISSIWFFLKPPLLDIEKESP